MRPLETHVAVVGAGAAGLYTALCAASQGAPVVLVSSQPLAESSSYWAQGGLAAAMSAQDSAERHLADTVAAGRGAVRESAARVLCDEASGAVGHLAELGVRFDADRHGQLALGLEGGHSARRIVHAGGAATGRRLIRQLSALVAENPLIEVLEGHRVVELCSDGERCSGVVLDHGPTIRGCAVVLATGGAAALWSRTTNPAGAIGGGLLLAFAAGATLADLELVQFHPTAVVAGDGADGLLVTEAVRGEGARLVDGGGERFIEELAPRDEVARAVQRRMASTGASSVGLDMREVDPALFPNVVSELRRAGIDPERQLVPVAPAAHYTMGGIMTDLHGRSSLAGLYAVGECSCTGLHGANRLASNSLTECFVFGARAARAAAAEPGPGRWAPGEAAGPWEAAPGEAPGPWEAAPGEAAGPWEAAPGEAAFVEGPGLAAPSEPERAAPSRPESAAPSGPESASASGPESASASGSSRAALWRHAGLERDGDGLRRLTEDPHPLVRLIAHCALARTESRGAHQRRDFPRLDSTLDGRHVTVRRGDEPRLETWR